MNIILMRHGQTQGNIERRYCGSTDDPLCQDGIAHAHASGRDETITRVFVSPMRRAVETAAIKFPNAEHTIIHDLREMAFGDFENKNADELAHDDAYRAWVDSNCEDRCPNGEKLSEFDARVCRAFDTLVRERIAAGDERIVVVAHGGTISAILGRFSGDSSRKFYEWYVGNCGGFRVRVDAQTWQDAPLFTDFAVFDVIGNS